MTISETLKKNWIYIAFAIIVILPLLYVGVALVNQMNEPSYALIIEELNDSEIIPFSGYFNEKGEVVNTTSVVSITDEDFKTFPKLAPIIRDKSQKSSYMGFNGRVTYRVNYWEEEHYTFVSHFGNSGYLEYKGKRYSFGFMHVD